MALARWSPVNELSSLHSTMDRLFGEMFEGTEGSATQAPTYRLPLDIQETKDGYVIKAPIAGFKPEEVDVTFADGMLLIKATHQEEKKQQEGEYIRREVVYGNFQRQIALPPDVQQENIKATFDHGVLSVEVPRKAKPTPKRIEVRSSQGKEGAKDNGKHLVSAGSQSSSSGQQKS